jgi:hypothetical protein
MTYDDEHLVTLQSGTWPGLAEAITAAGHILENNNGDWYANDAAAVQAIIDGYTPAMALSFAKAQATVEVSRIAKQVFDAAVVDTSPAEMAGWSILREEAKQYAVSGNEEDCPAIAFEAQQRGVSVPSLVERVQANVVKFDALRATIAGISGKHRDTITSLQTLEQVLSYDYTTDWPEV